MANLFEVLMVVFFGMSWPINIAKAWKARTAKGTSVVFYCLILIGYLFGLASKVIKLSEGISTPGYVWFVYCLNTCMTCMGIIIYFRNTLLDARAKNLQET